MEWSRRRPHSPTRKRQSPRVNGGPLFFQCAPFSRKKTETAQRGRVAEPSGPVAGSCRAASALWRDAAGRRPRFGGGRTRHWLASQSILLWQWQAGSVRDKPAPATNRRGGASLCTGLSLWLWPAGPLCETVTTLLVARPTERPFSWWASSSGSLQARHPHSYTVSAGLADLPTERLSHPRVSGRRCGVGRLRRGSARRTHSVACAETPPNAHTVSVGLRAPYTPYERHDSAAHIRHAEWG